LQVAAPQVQDWLVHAWVEEQAVQCAPPLPQAAVAVPFWHWSS